MNEEVIVECAKTDPEAFGRLYDTYYQPIFGFLLGRTGNVEIAKDLSSETFFQAIKNIKNYKIKGRPFKSWLFAIAVAQVGNYFRKKSKIIPVTMEECPELVADDIYTADAGIISDQDNEDQEIQIKRLRKYFKQLNPKQQDVLTLRYFSHQTISEISQVMKMKEGTVKSHLHRALKKLRILMSSNEKYNEYGRVKTSQSRRAFAANRIA